MRSPYLVQLAIPSGCRGMLCVPREVAAHVPVSNIFAGGGEMG
jgi:hypothetical protein